MEKRSHFTSFAAPPGQGDARGRRGSAPDQLDAPFSDLRHDGLHEGPTVATPSGERTPPPFRERRSSPDLSASSTPSWRPSASLTPMERYGRFEILGRVGRGGMAEILLARERSPAGTTRHLVIKRILPEVADSDEMLHMFLDEARVVMGLSHPNLCQIFEVGEQDGTWFIAMEWVHGTTLHALLKRALSEGMDYAVMARIVSQCAEALHHAHTARDANGEPLNLVHRDVSPHNIMIAYDGRVKLLDFGIAKSAVSTHHTEAGVVKGKVCYMAPEQWLSGPLDGRTDVFALGACLFEALTGRVVFKRDSQMDVMRAVLGHEVPHLSDLLPDVPRALEDIVERALAVAVEDRFQTALEMSDALEEFITSTRGPLGAAQVAEYTRELFSTEVREGPSLERSMYGSEMSPPPMLLPPVPVSLMGPPKPLPRSLTIPPPAFFGPGKPHESDFPSRAQGDELYDADAVTAPIESLVGVNPDLLSSAHDDDDAPFGNADEELPTRDLVRPSTFSDVPTRPHGTLADDERTEVVKDVQVARPLARTLSIPVRESVLRIASVAVPAAAAALLAVAGTLAFRNHTEPSGPTATPLRELSVPQVAAIRAEPAVTTPAASVATAQKPAAVEPAAPAHPRGTLFPQLGPDEGLLSLDSRPWSTVYLGKRLLGTTPLIGVVVPKGALMLKLVDGKGREHLRSVAASDDEIRRAFFDFEPRLRAAEAEAAAANGLLPPPVTEKNDGQAPGEAAPEALPVMAAPAEEAPAQAPTAPVEAPTDHAPQAAPGDSLPMREAPSAGSSLDLQPASTSAL